jgi:hypothetical protein
MTTILKVKVGKVHEEGFTDLEAEGVVIVGRHPEDKIGYDYEVYVSCNASITVYYRKKNNRIGYRCIDISKFRGADL